MNSIALCDGYKLDHRRQYPDKTTKIYSNFTPRSVRYGNGIKNIVVFGIQYFCMKYLIQDFYNTFFSIPKEKAVKYFSRRVNNYLGPNNVGTKHIEDLHDLGYIPVEIKALPEGSVVTEKIPVLTIENTKPEFFWVTNFLETIMSCILWQPMTSASIAYEYYKEFVRHSKLTGSPEEVIQFQGHDFSFRGMPGLEAAMMSGAGHLLSFTGTDTIPAIDFLEEYYEADSDKELVGASVPATEHSVMCMNGDYSGKDVDELASFKRLITEIYPTGIVSIVSDTWDFWKVMTEYLPALKEEIEARDGRVVIRPDSGNPVDIVCGHELSIEGYTWTDDICKTEAEFKGAYELLWDTFGGTINEKGYKVLNPKVGLIYGDSITIERQKEILRRLESKGFTASNLVLGIGSFTYTFNTRDTFGFAMKSTYGEVDGKGIEIYKDPKTDDGMKKSARGLLVVTEDSEGKFKLVDRINSTFIKNIEDKLETVFKEGKMIKTQSLSEIRNKLKSL